MLSDQLRDAIRSSGLSLRAVAVGSNVDYGSLYRFAVNGADIKVSTAGLLAEFFGMRLTKARRVVAPSDKRRKGRSRRWAGNSRTRAK